MTAYLIKIVAEIFCTVPIHDKVDVPNNCMVFISNILMSYLMNNLSVAFINLNTQGK